MTQLSILDITTVPALPVGVPFHPRSRTSRAAAQRLAPKVAGRREPVLALFRSGEQLTADEVARVKAEKSDLLWLLLPSLREDGSIRIPQGADYRYQHWREGSQTIWQMLAELNAPAATIRRYCRRVEQLHSGFQQCAGSVVELPELRYCLSCGWYEEAQATNELQTFLGF